MSVAVCIGCGCDDLRACWDDDLARPCAWIRLDTNAGRGVCSACPEHAERWDRGEREVLVPREVWDSEPPVSL